MPNPKDPAALEAYRQKQRDIAIERGFGKWMTGKKMSPETIEKMRQANLGKVISPAHRARLSAARRDEIARGKDLFGGAEGRRRQRVSAQSNLNLTYDERYGDRAEEERRKRRDGNRATAARRPRVMHRRQRHNDDWQYREWRQTVFARDDFTCQRCGVRGGVLHAHHIKAWADHPETRYEVTNGLTLHADCHRDLHKELRVA